MRTLTIVNFTILLIVVVLFNMFFSDGSLPSLFIAMGIGWSLGISVGRMIYE